jgi:hypothetical protein
MKITAIKVVFTFAFDSQAWGKSWSEKRIKNYIKRKFKGCTMVFSTGMWKGKQEHSAQVIVWLRDFWGDRAYMVFRTVGKCIQIMLDFGQYTSLLEINILHDNQDVKSMLMEFENTSL